MHRFSWNKMQNQIGSKPKVVTIGKKIGSTKRMIPTGSRNMPKTSVISCISKIIIRGLTSSPSR